MNLELAEDRERSLAVPCRRPPGCGVPIGEVCVRVADGQPLENLPAHPCRLDDAGVVHAPLDPRDLRRSHERTPRT